MSDTLSPSLGSWASEDIQRCPFPFLQRLLEEQPVYLDPKTGLYIITRYEDICFVCERPQLFSVKTGIIMERRDSSVAAEVQRRFAERGFPEIGTLPFVDPPEHKPQRALVDKVFTTSAVRNLEPQIQSLTDDIIDTFIERGEANILTQFAIQLPMFVIADQLGVPRSDWARFRRWSEWTVERNNPLLSPERELEIVDELIVMQHYLHERVLFYRKNPADNLITRLVTVLAESPTVSEAELINMIQIILVGGNETTTTAIAHSVNTLLEEPGLKARLEQDPGLIPNMIEETLRLHCPVPHLWRIATRDTTIGGVNVPKGAKLQMSYLAANRDPKKWQNPDEFELDRKGLRTHLTFGYGNHFCLGSNLARAETRIAITSLLHRAKDLRFSPDHPRPEITPHFQIHQLGDFHVRFAPAARLRMSTPELG